MKNAQQQHKDDLMAQVALVWPEAKLGRVGVEGLEWLLEVAQHLGDGGKRTMADTLNRYRSTYEDTAAYSGRLSKNNGDKLAKFLGGKSPDEVIRIAEIALKFDTGFLLAKYDNLNQGQRRMNAGNRIRAAIKREELTYDEVFAAC